MGLKVFLVLISSFLLLFIPIYTLQVVGKLFLLLLGVSWFYSVISWKYLSVRAESRIIRGFLHEKNQVTLHLSNNSFLPIPMLAIRDDTGGLNINGENFAIVQFAARSQLTFSYKIWSAHRGLHKLGPLHIAGSDPLGFFPWTLSINLERLVFIYPSQTDISFKSHHGIVGGPVKSHHPMFLDTTQLRSIRPYETGDDTRYIHWKASARTGILQSSEFTRNLTIPFYIVLNLCDSDFHNKRKAYHLERIVEAAAAFMGEAGSKQFSVGFLTNGSIPTEARPYLFMDTIDRGVLHIPISPALQASAQILSMLSVIEFGAKNLISCLDKLQFHLSPRCIVITPALLSAEFIAICSSIPRSCRIDFWFLDEHVLRSERVDHRALPPLSGVKIYKLPEYGEDLLDQEGSHGQ